MADKVRLSVDVEAEEVEGWSEEEKGLIHDAAVAMLDHIQARHRAKQDAHVHAKAHVIKRRPATFRAADPDKGEGGDDVLLEEELLISDEMICHDCGRSLINDAGSEPLLVCPKLHGLGIALRPSTPHGAVECGQPGI